MRVHMWPEFAGEDTGDGGVRRVVEGMRGHMGRFGVVFVPSWGDADVLACHITAPDQYIRLSGDRPLVAHCHGLYWSEYNWQEWAYRANADVARLICAADVVTAPTEWVARIIRRHWCRDVRVIPHGVNARDWTPPESGHRGYVLWNKTRVDEVCSPDAVNHLSRALPGIPFVTTFGEERPNVTVTGRLPFEAAREVVRHAGVYLCTTRETFGIGTLEAMAAGVPVVGYAFGGQAEFVSHGVDGWLVQPGDIKGLAEGVEWALANRDEVSRAARRTAERFTWQAAAEQYARVYTEVLDRYRDRDQSPRTTIVVTAYNLDRYLPNALDSVLAQTDPDWECIVVDDDSTDFCGDIADTYSERDERIRVIHNETNQYLAEARNIAIREARGRYILPLDADDMLTPDAVLTLADALDADREIHIAYGGVLFVDEDGSTPTNYGVRGVTPGHSGWPMAWDAQRQIRGQNLLPYASMFRREVWQLTGGYRRRLRTSEDADLWTRAASFGFGAAMVTQQDVLIYRNRPGSMSRSHTDARLAYLRWYPWAVDTSLAPAGVAGPRAISLLEPRVAVVIPVGPGHEHLVQDAVDSVLAQSYRSWECIVVNDTGADLELPAFVRQIRCNARDAAAARNVGIEAATAPLYVPLDADDYLQPDALQWMVTAFSELPEPHIIYTDFYEDPEEEGRFRPYQTPDYDCELLIRRGAIHAVTALVPVAVWRRVGGYRERVGWEDWDFQLRCARAGVCSRRLAAPLLTYRKHTGKRRHYDEVEFAVRRNEIMADWNDYLNGVKKMACGCSSRTARVDRPATVSASSAPAGGAGPMVQVVYTGSRTGTMRYRGQSGTIYAFSAADPPRYVLAEDAPMFERLPDFRVVAGTPPHSGPVLV